MSRRFSSIKNKQLNTARCRNSAHGLESLALHPEMGLTQIGFKNFTSRGML